MDDRWRLLSRQSRVHRHPAQLPQHVGQAIRPIRNHMLDWCPLAERCTFYPSPQPGRILADSGKGSVDLAQVGRNPLLARREFEPGPRTRCAGLPRKRDHFQRHGIRHAPLLHQRPEFWAGQDPAKRPRWKFVRRKCRRWLGVTGFRRPVPVTDPVVPRRFAQDFLPSRCAAAALVLMAATPIRSRLVPQDRWSCPAQPRRRQDSVPVVRRKDADQRPGISLSPLPTASPGWSESGSLPPPSRRTSRNSPGPPPRTRPPRAPAQTPHKS